MIPKAHKIAVVILFLSACGLSLGFYWYLPDSVPLHWNISGAADRFGSKWEALLLGPGLCAALPLLMILLALIGPLRRNIESFRVIYGRMLVVLTAAMLAIHAVVLLKASGSDMDIGRTMAILIGVLIAVVGNWLSKVRRNFWLGIRTPWTLMSDRVWERTHRLGAKLFVACGVLSVIAGLLAPAKACFVVLIGSVSLAAIVLTIYSVVIYRRIGESEEVTWQS